MGESGNVLSDATLTEDQGNVVQSVWCFMASFVAGQKKTGEFMFLAWADFLGCDILWLLLQKSFLNFCCSLSGKSLAQRSIPLCYSQVAVRSVPTSQSC